MSPARTYLESVKFATAKGILCIAVRVVGGYSGSWGGGLRPPPLLRGIEQMES